MGASLGNYLLNSVAAALGALCPALWLNRPLLGALYALLMLIQPSPLLSLMLALSALGALPLVHGKPLLAGISLGLAALPARLTQPWRRSRSPLLLPRRAGQHGGASARHARLAAPDWRGAVRCLRAIPPPACACPTGRALPPTDDLDGPPAAAQIGLWLAENTAPEAQIIANEAALIGYYALPRRLLDLDGKIMPALRDTS